MYSIFDFSRQQTGTDHCLIDVEFRERLAVSKRATQRFGMERFSLKINGVEGKVKISNRFTVLET
jgi:hypothetical protein